MLIFLFCSFPSIPQLEQQSLHRGTFLNLVDLSAHIIIQSGLSPVFGMGRNESPC